MTSKTDFISGQVVIYTCFKGALIERYSPKPKKVIPMTNATISSKIFYMSNVGKRVIKSDYSNQVVYASTIVANGKKITPVFTDDIQLISKLDLTKAVFYSRDAGDSYDLTLNILDLKVEINSYQNRDWTQLEEQDDSNYDSEAWYYMVECQGSWFYYPKIGEASKIKKEREADETLTADVNASIQQIYIDSEWN